jgi:hypothetical protein
LGKLFVGKLWAAKLVSFHRAVSAFRSTIATRDEIS